MPVSFFTVAGMVERSDGAQRLGALQQGQEEERKRKRKRKEREERKEEKENLTIEADLSIRPYICTLCYFPNTHCTHLML